MSFSSIRPVILCGGNGTRLWPSSRKSMPKQFSKFNDSRTLLQNTLHRVEDSGCGAPLVIASDDHRFIVDEQVREIGVQGATIVIEPTARNTAPAICAAAELVFQEDPDALLLVVPSDHIIKDDMAFARAVTAGIPAAQDGKIVTFGIRPTRPDTGYGYIELADSRGLDEQPQRFPSFIEKPSPQGAQAMLEKGCFAWNSGIFLMSVRSIRDVFEHHVPRLRSVVRLAVQERRKDLSFVRLGESFSNVCNVSFERAIMELETGIVVPVAPGWSDLGNWNTVWQASPCDDMGVATSGNAMALSCEDSLLRSDDPETQIVGIGLKNIVAVATRDAVLVADRNAVPDIGRAVCEMNEIGIKQATEFPRQSRPWGYYETLSLGPRYQVKAIVVKPGGRLSLQSHAHRAEHWVVVEGSAKVTIGSKQKVITENQSVYIPLGETHRLENEGKVPLRLIEVQTGSYLGEDDIVRYSDIYERA